MKKTIENAAGIKQEVEFMDYGRKYKSGAFTLVKKKGSDGDIITVSADSGLFKWSLRNKKGQYESFFILDYGMVNESWRSLVDAYLMNVFAVANIVNPNYQKLVLLATDEYMKTIPELPDNPDADARAIEIQKKMDVVSGRIKEAADKMKEMNESLGEIDSSETNSDKDEQEPASKA